MRILNNVIYVLKTQITLLNYLPNKTLTLFVKFVG